jgi:hypothetical protein
MSNIKTYAINVDFSQVEQEYDTIRKTALEDKFIVKWIGDTPSSISATSAELFNYAGILAEIEKEEWQSEDI